MTSPSQTSDAPKKTQYELPTGAIAILEEILPTPSWYKDDPKQARIIVAAVSAADALPETAPRPKPEKDESRESFEARVDTWAASSLMFEWSDRQKEAVKKCVAFYLRGGNLAANVNTASLIRLLSLDDE